MQLYKLSNLELDQRIKKQFKQECEVLHDVVQTIKEIDRRQLYLQMNYSSLFDYLTKEVGYANGTAQRRIHAARLISEIPEAAESIRTGELSLNKITMVQSAVREAKNKAQFQKRRGESVEANIVSKEEKKELLNIIINSTEAESQQLVAEVFDLKPKEQTKKKIQRNGSVRYEITFSKELNQKIERAKELYSHIIPDGDVTRLFDYLLDKAIEFKTKTPKKRTTVHKSKSTSTVEVRPNVTSTIESSSFVSSAAELKIDNEIKGHARAEEMRLINEAQESFGIAKNKTVKFTSEAEVESVVNFVQEQKSHDKTTSIMEANGVHSFTRKINVNCSSAPEQNSQDKITSTMEVKINKSITPKTRKEILRRDECCQYKDPMTGQICGSRWQLEVDHIQPKWAGGTNAPENLQVLCRQHNNFKYRRNAGIQKSLIH